MPILPFFVHKKAKCNNVLGVQWACLKTITQPCSIWKPDKCVYLSQSVSQLPCNTLSSKKESWKIISQFTTFLNGFFVLFHFINSFKLCLYLLEKVWKRTKIIVFRDLTLMLRQWTSKIFSAFRKQKPNQPNKSLKMEVTKTNFAEKLPLIESAIGM